MPRPAEKPLTEAIARGERRAKLIGLTDLELTVTHTVRERLADEPRYKYYRRVLTGAENCGLCVVASTQRYRKGDLMPIHPNCVPEGTRVQARNISGATRRWYSGELAVITTARGDLVSVTPNHPVLTDRGWVPAGEVREGDHVVRSSRTERVVLDGPHEGQAPPLAEDVWGALAVAFDFVQVPLAAEDFHGDGSDGEVDVVRADGYFSTVGDEAEPQHGLEDFLVSGEGWRIPLPSFSDAAALVPTGLASADSSVGGGGLLGALLGTHLCSAHEAGLGTAASWDAGVSEPTGDDVPRDPMLVREHVLGESVLDVVDPELFSRVAHVGRVDFAGHVFNFHTRLGTYEADSHIVHNCDCIVEPLPDDAPHVLDRDLLESAHQAIAETFGKAAIDGRSIDYRKIITVQNHAEMGPLLTVSRHKFSKRQLRDNDLTAKGR